MKPNRMPDVKDRTQTGLCHYVYRLEALNPADDRKFYLGVRSCLGRPEDDVSYWSSSRPVHRAIEAGVQFRKDILFVFDTRALALAKEIELHGQHDVGRDPTYFNQARQVADGFDTQGVAMTEETRRLVSERTKQRLAETGGPAKISAGLKKYFEDPANREKLSAQRRGVKKPPEFGDKVSKGLAARTPKQKAETSAKMSAAAKGKVVSPETRGRMSAAKKGVKLSEEHRASMSASRKDFYRNNPEARAKLGGGFRSRSHSAETRARMSEASQGRVFSPQTKLVLGHMIAFGCRMRNEQGRLPTAAERKAEREKFLQEQLA